MKRLYRNGAVIIALTAVSAFCLFVPVGVWLYAGSPLPQTQGATAAEARELWIEWSAIIAVPIVTTVLWIFRLTDRSANEPI